MRKHHGLTSRLLKREAAWAQDAASERLPAGDSERAFYSVRERTFRWCLET
jgi:hypothetical protein